MHTKWTSRFPRRPALVGAVVLVAGAGALAVRSSATASPKAPGPPVDRALAATLAAGSAQFTSLLRFELVAPDRGAPATVVEAQRFAGRFETSGRRAVVTVTEDTGRGPVVAQRLRLDRPRYWVAGAPGEEFAPGKPWALADLGVLERRLGPEVADRLLAGVRTASASDVTPVLEMLRAVRTRPAAAVRELGAARRGGAPVRRYGVVIDFRALYKALGTRVADAKSWLSPALLGWLPRPFVPAVVELDGRGRLRALSFTALLDVSESELQGMRLAVERRAPPVSAAGAPDRVPDGARLRLRFSAVLSRFGTPVIVTPPPPGQVADLFELSGGPGLDPAPSGAGS